ncbi:Bax inhibitor-1/YccA family protein ['Elaeagnus angustifolia' witches'-broom phytoplasma]|uniref:Bax inhibitor-1/YccA family protein n=1 Tax='Elaeagnus angustifolia' witches'-broom phytoplasma TaxID=1538355 RepID=A0ABS5VA73_9MOLU|nr:Bax inhibitor-1/YccA family protein ['Elaeagnus angustifolia' witches'-broom phytoplasma]MCX2955475.1 Bax inhibitor-1/YccA family protein [Candidatus Phytoplasma australiense]
MQTNKVNNSFTQIKNNFLSLFETTTYNNIATRKGIALKTILLLCVTAITSMFFYPILKPAILKNLNIHAIYFSMIALGFLNYGIYSAGLKQVEISKACGLIYSFIEGIILSIIFCCSNLVYANLVEIAFMAIFATFIVFVAMSHAYYKGFIKVTNRFRQIMLYCSFALVASYIVRLVLSLCGIWTIENIIYNSFLTLPISLIMLGFVSMFLALHFDYTEQMIKQGMPKKYEWQVSLALATTLIEIFLRIMLILLRLFGQERK